MLTQLNKQYEDWKQVYFAKEAPESKATDDKEKIKTKLAETDDIYKTQEVIEAAQSGNYEIFNTAFENAKRQVREDESKVLYEKTTGVNVNEETGLGENFRVGEMFIVDSEGDDLNDRTVAVVEIKKIHKSTGEIILTYKHGGDGAEDPVVTFGTFKEKYNEKTLIHVPTDPSEFKKAVSARISTKSLDDKPGELPDEGFLANDVYGVTDETFKYKISGNNYYINDTLLEPESFLALIVKRNIKEVTNKGEIERLARFYTYSPSEAYKQFHFVGINTMFSKLYEIGEKFMKNIKESQEFGALYFSKKLFLLGPAAGTEIDNYESKKVSEFKTDIFDPIDADEIEKYMAKFLKGNNRLPWPRFSKYDTKWFVMAGMLAFAEKTGNIIPLKEEEKGDATYWFRKMELMDMYKQFDAEKMSPDDIMKRCLKNSPKYSKSYLVKFESALKTGNDTKKGTTSNLLQFETKMFDSMQNFLWLVGFNPRPEDLKEGDLEDDKRKPLTFSQVCSMPLTEIAKRMEGKIFKIGTMDPVEAWEIITKSPISPTKKFVLAYLFTLSTTKATGVSNLLTTNQGSLLKEMTRKVNFPILSMMESGNRDDLRHLMTKGMNDMGITNFAEAWKFFLVKDKNLGLVTKVNDPKLDTQSKRAMINYKKELGKLFDPASKNETLDLKTFRDYVHETFGFGLLTEQYMTAVFAGGNAGIGQNRVVSGPSLTKYLKQLENQLDNADRFLNDTKKSKQEKDLLKDEIAHFNELLTQTLGDPAKFEGESISRAFTTYGSFFKKLNKNYSYKNSRGQKKEISLKPIVKSLIDNAGASLSLSSVKSKEDYQKDLAKIIGEAIGLDVLPPDTRLIAEKAILETRNRIRKTV